MAEMAILKPEILKEISGNTELKNKISESNFGLKPDSIRVLAGRYSNTCPSGKITEYNILRIVQQHLKIKKMDDMFITKEIVK